MVWYHRLIGETEGPTLITDTACTATYCRFPSWHTVNYLDNRRIGAAGAPQRGTPLIPLQFTGVAAPSIYAGFREATMRNDNEIKPVLTALRVL